MRRNKRTTVLALCGVLAALAVALLFLGGTLPFATIACPVLASLVLIPVYAENGAKWGFLWYVTTALLGVLLTPDKETAVLFVFFGYYPMLKRFLERLPGRTLTWIAKLVYQMPTLREIRDYCRAQVDTLWDEVKRFDNPHTYYVDLSQKLWDIKYDLLKNNSGSAYYEKK